MRYLILLFVLQLLAGFVHGVPPDSQSVTLETIIASYENLRYERTVKQCEEFLSTHPRLPEAKLLKVLQYLAMSQLALGEEEQAKRTLQSIIIANPEYSLDRRIVSPKLIELYRNQRARERQSGDISEPAVQYLVKEDLRTEAMLRSVIFPGLGQTYLDQSRGYLYAGIAGISLGIFGYSVIQTPRAHERYLGATDPQNIEQRYATYNRLYQLRNNSLIVYLGTWMIAGVDAFISSRPSGNLRISLNGIPTHLTVTLLW